jgi:hypothetical protein
VLQLLSCLIVIHFDVILSFFGHIQGMTETYTTVMVGVDDTTEVHCVQKINIAEISEFGP